MPNFRAQAQALVRSLGEVASGFDKPAWLSEPSRDCDGIFDSRHFEAEAGGEISASILVTTLSIAEADLAEGDSVADAEVVYCRGRTLKVVDRRPDGQGMLTLALEFQPE